MSLSVQIPGTGTGGATQLSHILIRKRPPFVINVYINRICQLIVPSAMSGICWTPTSRIGCLNRVAPKEELLLLST